jgi:exonuclease III
MAYRDWNILCWIIRGFNSADKWDVVRNKIEESGCSIVCIQETKCAEFDSSFIRQFAPRRFDSFEYIPSIGASSGILIIWSSSLFVGTVVEKLQFSLTISFSAMHNGDQWHLTNVYSPCQEPDRSSFLNWFKNCEVDDTINWLFLGDFNFYRSLENKNKPGGNILDTLHFNYAIGHLGLMELPLKGRKFTWSNMQMDPLLEQLDWFFISPN